QSTAALTYEDKGAAEEILRALSAQRRVVGACIYKGNEIFAQYPAESSANRFPSRPEAGGSRFEGDHLLLFHPISLASESIGTLYFNCDLTEMHERLKLYAGLIGLFMAASLGITFLLSSMLQRIITKPIFHLAQT